MKSIILRTEEARRLQETGGVTIRRAVKPQPPEDVVSVIGPEMYYPTCFDKNGEEYPGKEIFGIFDDWGEWGAKCPYQPGEVLWVKETWNAMDIDGGSGLMYSDVGHGEQECMIWDVVYKATAKYPHKWLSSIHMPRWASRADVLVGDVRVEQGVEWDWVIELERE